MTALLSRRDLLRGASAAALASLLPSGLWGALEGRTVRSDRTLILIELEGGNDGLNTIVPLTHLTRYNDWRPTLRLTESTNLASFDYQRNYFNLGTTFRGAATGLANQAQASDCGIHAALEKLRPAWQAGDMAVALGVGYAQPNLSHFRGIDIWNTGATDMQPLASSGWLGRMFNEEGLNTTSKTNAVLFRRANNSPVANAGSKAISMGSPEDFIANSKYLIGEYLDDGDPRNDIPALVTAAPAATGNAALDRILTARWQVVEARTKVISAMTATEPGHALAARLDDFKTLPTQIDLMSQARHAFRCIAGGLDCPVYKLSINGFDTHTDQRAKHADLLGAVGMSIAALRTALIAAGKWDSTLIMTYSEFGRRIAENGSAGTDHGTASPHFFFGGGIRGGIYGTQPTLAVANRWNDMDQTMDFRRLYATCGAWLGVASAADGLGVDPFSTGLSFSPLSSPLGDLLV